VWPRPTAPGGEALVSIGSIDTRRPLACAVLFDRRIMRDRRECRTCRHLTFCDIITKCNHVLVESAPFAKPEASPDAAPERHRIRTLRPGGPRKRSAVADAYEDAGFAPDRRRSKSKKSIKYKYLPVCPVARGGLLAAWARPARGHDVASQGQDVARQWPGSGLSAANGKVGAARERRWAQPEGPSRCSLRRSRQACRRRS